MTNPTLTAEDWITRADMAVLMRKSVATVHRIEKKHELTTSIDDAGRVLVKVGDLLEPGKIRPEDITTGATPAESAQMLRARETVTTLRTELAELTGRLSYAETLVETLREQLGVKDRQIGQQASQLTQLIGRLGQLGGAA